MPLDFLLRFSSVLQALTEHLLFGCNCGPGGGTTKQHGGLGWGRACTHLRLNASPLLISYVVFELLSLTFEPWLPTCKMRLIIYMVFRIEK